MNMLKSLYVDKQLFKTVFMYGVFFFAVFFSLSEIFSRILGVVSTKISSLAGITEITMLTAEQAEGVAPITSLLLLIVFVIVLFFIVQFYNYAFFENLIWNTIIKRKTTFKNTNKFFALNILLTAIFAVLLSVLFIALVSVPEQLLVISTMLFYLALLFSIYLIYTGYLNFSKSNEILSSIKAVYTTGIKKLNITIKPLFFVLIVGLLANIILLPFMNLPEIIALIVQIVVLSAYLAWFRIYITKALKAVKL